MTTEPMPMPPGVTNLADLIGAEERAATIAHLGGHCLIQPGDCAGMANLRGLLAQAVNLLLTKEASQA